MEIKVVTDNDKEFVMSIDKHVNDIRILINSIGLMSPEAVKEWD